MLTAFLYDPVSRLHQLNQLVQAGRAAGERVFEILDEPAEPGISAKIESVGEPDRRRVKRDDTRERFLQALRCRSRAIFATKTSASVTRKDCPR